MGVTLNIKVGVASKGCLGVSPNNIKWIIGYKIFFMDRRVRGSLEAGHLSFKSETQFDLWYHPSYPNEIDARGTDVWASQYHDSQFFLLMCVSPLVDVCHPGKHCSLECQQNPVVTETIRKTSKNESILRWITVFFVCWDGVSLFSMWCIKLKVGQPYAIWAP